MTASKSGHMSTVRLGLTVFQLKRYKTYSKVENSRATFDTKEQRITLSHKRKLILNTRSKFKHKWNHS